MSSWFVARPRPSGRGVAGISLMELMVACSLFVIISGVLAFMLRAAGRIGLAFFDQSATQQQCQLVQRFLQERIYRALPDSLYCPSAQAFTWLHCEDNDGVCRYDSASQVLWQAHGVLYFDTVTHTLRWQNKPLAAATPAPSPLQLTTYAAGPRDRIVASSVSSFSVRVQGSCLYYKLNCSQGKSSTEVWGAVRTLLPEENS